MKSAAVNSSAARDAELAELIDQLTARLKAGERPDASDLCREYPDHADELLRLLPAVQVLAELPRSTDDGTPLGELGDYRILREVGRGGMGVVYEAEQVSLGRRVALKVLPYAATMDSKQLQRFKNEARAAAGLKHEHIVSVFAVGCERGVHFYSMEFIDGQTLAQVIADLFLPSPLCGRGAGGEGEQAPLAVRSLGSGTLVPPHPRPLSHKGERGEEEATAAIAVLSTERSGPKGRAFYRTAAELIAQAADALEHAHGLGIVHRDVKPANLMVDDGGKLWVTDFGLARLGPDAGLTASNDLLGTLRYMAPEQALAKHGLVDHRADVYALGATLYELLSGRPVVDAAERADILRQIAFDEPLPPRKLERTIPAELETIALKCLAKDPAERYATAGELADDLRRFVQDQPIRAKPPTLPQQAARWARRHQSAVIAAGAVLALATVLLTGCTVWIWCLKNEADKALEDAKASKARAIDRQMQMRELLGAAFQDAGVYVGVFQENLRLGKLNEAMGAYNRLTDIGRRAADQPWLDFEATQGIYFICCGLTNFSLASHRYEEADEPSRLAMAIAEHLLKAPSGEAFQMPRAFRNFPAAGAFTTRAEILRAAGRWDEAETCYRRANALIDAGFGAIVKMGDQSDTQKEDRQSFVKEVDGWFKPLVERENLLGLGFVLAGKGRPEEAAEVFAQALAVAEERAQLDADDVCTSGHWAAAALQARGDAFWDAGRRVEATDCYRQFLAVRGLLATCYAAEMAKWAEFDGDDLAWFLATCRDEQLRDYARAEELAAEIMKDHPWLHRPLVIRAIARFRADDIPAAQDALRQAAILYRQSGNDCHATFYAAMIHWRQGRAKVAGGMYELAIRRTAAIAPQDDSLRQLRAEAAALLGRPALDRTSR